MKGRPCPHARNRTRISRDRTTHATAFKRWAAGGARYPERLAIPQCDLGIGPEVEQQRRDLALQQVCREHGGEEIRTHEPGQGLHHVHRRLTAGAEAPTDLLFREPRRRARPRFRLQQSALRSME